MTIKIENSFTRVETLLAIELARDYDASKFDKRLITVISMHDALKILPPDYKSTALRVSIIATVFVQLMLLAKLCDNNSLYPIPVTASKELVETNTTLDADVIFVTLYADMLTAFTKGLHDKALQVVWRIAANVEYLLKLYNVEVTPKDLESQIENVLSEAQKHYNFVGVLPKAK